MLLQTEIREAVNEEIVDATELAKAVSRFMDEKEKDVIIYDDNRYARLIRPVTRSWDVDKLEKLLPKGLFRKVTKRVPDAGKIDELVADEEIELSDIEDALVEKPGKAYAKTFVGDPDKAKDND